MPVTYIIDADARLIRTRCSEDVTFPEVLDHFRELGEIPNCPKRLDVLLDVADIKTLPDSRQLQTIGGAIRRLREQVRFGFCAIVAPRDAVFGMLRVFEVVTQDYFREIRVFRTASEAQVWLDARRASASMTPSAQV